MTCCGDEKNPTGEQQRLPFEGNFNDRLKLAITITRVSADPVCLVLCLGPCLGLLIPALAALSVPVDVTHFNDRPYWRMSLHHCILYGKLWDGCPVPECWCLANLKCGQDCFHVLDRPVAPQTSGMFPPEGAWIRGRPWMNDTCFPHRRVQFYISKA